MTHDDLEKRDAHLSEEKLPAAEQSAEPAADAADESPRIAAMPMKKRGGFWRGLALLLGVLLLLLVAGGVAAFAFKNQDERLRIFADAIESAAKNPGAAASAVSAQIEGWTRELLGDDGGKVQTKSTAPRVAAPKTTAPPPPRSVEPQRLAEAPRPADDAAAAPVAPTLSAPPSETKPAAAREDLAALQAQIAEAAEKSKEALDAAREALATAKEAQRAAADKTRESAEKPPAAPALSEQSDNLTALEGRIDELGSEIKQLRDRLDQPKETARVDAEAQQAAKPADAREIAAVEMMALSQLQSEALHHGRPFAAETAALKERGADPTLLAALTPLAERGAPTAAALLAEFAPIARSLQAQAEPGREGDSFTDGLLRILGKLVRVKGAGAPPAASIEARIVEVEVALAHDEVNDAAESFAKLPVESSSDAKAFGAKLKELAQARQAAADLIASAVAGLGHLKN